MNWNMTDDNKKALENFQQSAKLARLLKKLDIPRTTLHGLRDTHASFLFSNDNIRLDYISQRLGHSNLQTTMNYYLELMPEKLYSKYLYFLIMTLLQN